MKLHKVIQEILTKHVNGKFRNILLRMPAELRLGIDFREWNAGSQIDGDMSEEGGYSCAAPRPIGVLSVACVQALTSRFGWTATRA